MAVISYSLHAPPSVGETFSTRVTNNASTSRGTAITPAAGKRLRVISTNADFVGALSNGIEVYFGTGANIGTEAGKAVFEASQDGIGPVFEAWYGGAERPLGLLGDQDEVLSFRGKISAAEDVNLIIMAREE